MWVGMRSVAAATTQRGGGVEDDIMLKYHIQEFPSALSGYTLLHLSRPLILAFIVSLVSIPPPPFSCWIDFFFFILEMFNFSYDFVNE
jgi:hypothetical protein